MTDSSLLAILRHAQQSASPVTVSLQGSGVRELLVRTVGDCWFSAREHGVGVGEFVVSLTAVHMISGVRFERAYDSSGLSRVPLHAILFQLERQRTTIILHIPELSLVGRISEVGADFLALDRSDGTELLIPLCAFLWLEACG